MLSFNHLGNMGRLGNQMFQYASLKGIAKHRGYEYCIPPEEVFGNIDTNVRKSDISIYNIFDIKSKNNISLTRNPVLPERGHEFDEELYLNCPDQIDLFGYYQTEKYFSHIEDEIREDFSFNLELVEMCQNFIQDNFDSEIISLHVRRGDYTINPNHPLQNNNFYKKSIENLPKDLPILVFSDDYEWCKNSDLFSSDRFIISENNSTDFDLCLMSMCNYHIIANSSFSWWGAWLAKSKMVIAPNNWFGGECIDKCIEDMKFKNFYFIEEI
jgi:hypothetical protein